MRRNWIKLYIDQCLRGTMMDEMQDPAERFVWFGILLLAGDSAYEGKIALTEDMGYSDDQLGSMLKCDPILIKRAKKIMVKFDKIKIFDNNVIHIVNWKKYQSEYQRQKPYRSEDGQKLLRKVTNKGDDEGLLTEGDRDIDRDIEKNKEEEKVPPYLRIKFNFKKKQWQGIVEKDLKRWKKIFPDVDIEYHIFTKMVDWIILNPRKGRKKNYARFINNWLSDEQEKFDLKNAGKRRDEKRAKEWLKEKD